MTSVSKAEEKEQTADEILMDAILHGDTAGVRTALRNGAHVTEEYYGGQTPLTRACRYGRDDIVRILLDAGADAWWRDGNGWSSIMIAAYERKFSTVQLLLNHDSDLLEIEDSNGWTPLFYVVRSGNVKHIRFMLDRGANVHATATMTSTGYTILHIACQWGTPVVARIILAAGVDIEARETLRQTALHIAMNYRDIDLVRELILQHNANMCAADKDGNTPFDIACSWERNGRSADPILEIYGEKLTQDHDRFALHVHLKAATYSFPREPGFRPPKNPIMIHLPLGKLRLQQLRTLFQYCGTGFIRNRDNSGKLLIHVACQTKAPVEVLAMLAEFDPATLQIADYTGALPLHECCCGVVDDSSVRYLVEHGGVGTLAARNREGALPLHLLCGSTNLSWRTVHYLIQLLPGSVSMGTNAGIYPFMIAAATNSSSLSVVYNLLRANPGLMAPR